MYGLLASLASKALSSGVLGSALGASGMGGASQGLGGLMQGQGVTNLGMNLGNDSQNIQALGKEVHLQAKPMDQMAQPMQMAQNDAMNIQQDMNQPQPGLASQFLDQRQNQVMNQWQAKKDLWNNSDGLMDYARQSAMQRMSNGNFRNIGMNQPQLQAIDLNSLMQRTRY